MDFDRELYPEQMRDKLEKAVKNSAENYVDDIIKEEEPVCDNCGSEEFSPKIEKKEGKEFDETAVCNSCGEEKSFEVNVKDLKDASPF
jgi:superfamily II helicase